MTRETSNGACADTHLAGVGKSNGTPILDVGQYHTGGCSGKHVFMTPWSPSVCSGQAAINTWYKYSGAFVQSGGTMNVYNSDGAVNTASTTSGDAVTGAYMVGFGYFARGDLDDLIIAAYTSPEPAWST